MFGKMFTHDSESAHRRQIAARDWSTWAVRNTSGNNVVMVEIKGDCHTRCYWTHETIIICLYGCMKMI